MGGFKCVTKLNWGSIDKSGRKVLSVYPPKKYPARREVEEVCFVVEVFGFWH